MLAMGTPVPPARRLESTWETYDRVVGAASASASAAAR
jgi:hypothetical protein